MSVIEKLQALFDAAAFQRMKLVKPVGEPDCLFAVIGDKQSDYIVKFTPQDAVQLNKLAELKAGDLDDHIAACLDNAADPEARWGDYAKAVRKGLVEYFEE